MARELNILEKNLKFKEIVVYLIFYLTWACFVLIFFISRKQYSILEVPKCTFLQIPQSQVLAVEINREGAFIQINTVHDKVRNYLDILDKRIHIPQGSHSVAVVRHVTPTFEIRV